MSPGQSSPVSIVIPARNEGAWVKRTVDAVMETANPLIHQVIVVDDQSTDGCCEPLRGLDPSSRVSVISGTASGSAAARAFGASRATSDLLVFLDAHVLPEAGWLEVLLAALDDPTVGLAGLGVRDVEYPAVVGYGYTFVDENLTPGWADWRGTEPRENPCISGCCIGVRREVFEEIGAFDPGHRRWGVEDVELSLRAWFLGYRCVVSPSRHVSHYFRHDKPRNYAISWEEYDVNLLRCAWTYFSGRRLQAILAGARKRENYERSWQSVVDDQDFWRRRESLRARFQHDEDWYFQRFTAELSRFEERVRVLTTDGDSAMQASKNHALCSKCGATNCGQMKQCLLCGASLPIPVSTRPPVQTASHVTQLPADAVDVCQTCATPLPSSSARFCPACGTSVIAAPAAPTPAPTTHPCTNPACRQVIPVGTPFCSHCGHRQGAPQPPRQAQHAPATPTSIQCPQCRRTVPPGKKFCTGCGCRVS
jgi:GT2 family glycosyltransferase